MAQFVGLALFDGESARGERNVGIMAAAESGAELVIIVGVICMSRGIGEGCCGTLGI